MESNPPLNKLKKLRQERNISIREMSRRTRISKSMCAYIECGKKRLSYEQAIQIANVFNLSPDEVFLGDYDEFYKNSFI